MPPRETMNLACNQNYFMNVGDPMKSRITDLSATKEEWVFSQLMHHFSVDSMQYCYRRLQGNTAIGSDGITKAQAILKHRSQRIYREPNALIGRVGF